MSGHGDYSDDMSPIFLDDAQTEALLRGEAATPAHELAGVSAFILEMRACASQPPPAPSPALAALLRQGTQAQPVGTVGAAPGRRGGESRLRRWPRRVAVTALGLAVGVTGAVGAGAAGLLPGPAERFVAGVVETLTPLHLPGDRPKAGDRRIDEPRDPVAGQAGSDKTGVGPGPAASNGAPGVTTGAGAGSPPGPSAGTGGSAGEGGPPRPGSPEPGIAGGSGGGSGPAVTAPSVTTPPSGTGPLPTAPATTPTVPTVTTPTVPPVSTTLPKAPSPPTSSSVPVPRLSR